MSTLLAINNYHYPRGGGEGVFFEHNRLLAERGWNVVPFSMQHPKNLPSPWSSHFIEELEFENALPLPQKIRMGAKAVYSFEARSKIGDLISRTQPTIAHCHNIYHHISPSILHELKGHGIPVVMTLHDLKIACPAYKMLSHNEICERCKGGNFHNLLLRRCMKGSLALSGLVWLESALHRWLGSYTRCVDRFVVPSKFFLEKFVEWGWPREKFIYIPNFIDVSRLEPQYAAGERFVYFGRLSEEKGVDTFVSAVARSGTKGTIVGTGPMEDKLKALVASTGADVQFAGFQTGASLHALIAGARAIVLPSVWYENAPLSLMEASALGKPVLGARIGGIPELIREGETGAIFESGSTEALADLLQQYQKMSDAEIGTQGRSGREWIASAFSSSRYVESVSELYRNILLERR